MKIQIAGSGCSKCEKLEANVREAVAQKGIEASIEKITDMEEMLDLGVMITPALLIDGEVRSAGKVLSVEQILAQFK